MLKQFKFKKLKFLNVNRKKKTTEVVYLFGERVSSSIGRTIISGLAVIGFFYIAPVFINFANEEIFSNEFQNDSRKVMVYKLNGKEEEISVDLNETFDEKDLLSDILTLNDLETESVRLSASTISQLFE
ncbi:glucosaminidase, partial [Candidatus Pelagibacter sp.]|nr:glucosaminidase [Candidatus Pelagibacter sp.]